MMKSWFLKVLSREEERFFLWSPVCLGGGIVIYFSLSFEPSLMFLFAIAGSTFFLSGVAFRCASLGVRRTLWGMVLLGMGFSLGAYRVALLDPPMLHQEVGPFFWEATIASVQIAAAGNRVRTVLILKDLSTSSSLPKKSFPKRVRLPLKGMDLRWHPGQRIGVRAVWIPIGKAPSPLGFDPRRHAFFKGVGATGYALSEPQLLGQTPSGGVQEKIQKIRQGLTHHLMNSLSAPLGSLAAALVTGEASALSSDMRETFAGAGIAHILAISGLHLSLVGGIVFWFLWRSLSLFPFLALRYPLHKIAAFCAIGASFFYLELSGAAPPAQRAFLMTALMMGACLLDRRVLSFRNLAVAALGVLVISPESVMGPSFQLSFSAVVALVATYEVCWKHLQKWGSQGTLPFKKIVVYGFNSLLSSLVATLATTPFTIVFFHQLTLQSLVSNLVVIPLVSFCIMPLLVLGCFWYFLSGEGFLFSLLALPLRGLWEIAQQVNSWPGAHLKVPVGPFWAFPLFVGGALWACLWKTSLRYLGLFPAFLGLGGLFIPDVPDFWIDGEGKLLGFFEARGRVLWVSSLQRGSFARSLWMEASAASEVRVFPSQKEEGWGKTGEGFFWTCFPNKSCAFLVKDPVPPILSKDYPLMISLVPSAPVPLKNGFFLGLEEINRYGSHVIWMGKKNPYLLRVQKKLPLQEGRRWS